MTPQELAKTVEDDRVWQATLKAAGAKDVAAEDEWDAVADFWEAIDIMQDSLQQMEMLCKMDLDLKFLNKKERARLMQHTANLMTFLDLYVEAENGAS